MNNKEIIKHCPNFYRIINFEFFEGDKLTEKLIGVYEKFIFSIDAYNPSDLLEITKLDKILAKYLDDYAFRSELKYNLLHLKLDKKEDLLRQLINSIIGIFDAYEEGNTRKIYVSKYI